MRWATSAGIRDSRVLVVAVSAVGFIVVISTVAIDAGNWPRPVHTWIEKGKAAILTGGLALAALFVAGVLRFIALPCTLLFRAPRCRAVARSRPARIPQMQIHPRPWRVAQRAREGSRQGPDPATPVRPTVAALCIHQPQRAAAPSRWFAGLMATHPPIEERIAWLRAMEASG